MNIVKTICLFITIALAPVSAESAPSDHATIRRQAQKAYQDGNWNDAYALFRQLGLEAVNDPKMVGRDFVQAWQCLRNLNRLNELDEFREEVIEKHVDNWRLLQAAAGSSGFQATARHTDVVRLVDALVARAPWLTRGALGLNVGNGIHRQRGTSRFFDRPGRQR